MAAANETVRERASSLGATLTPLQIALAVGLLVAAFGALLFGQAPMLHDALHDFRHVAGVTCH